MIRALAYLVTMGFILSGSNALAADSNKELLAFSAAEQWLTMVDNQKYDDSWKKTSEFFRNAVQLEQWVQSMQAVRKPLGKLISRTVKTTVYTSALPGAPDGEYVVIQFDTLFENKKAAVETVTPMLDTDGVWRVSGYYIK